MPAAAPRGACVSGRRARSLLAAGCAVPFAALTASADFTEDPKRAFAHLGCVRLEVELRGNGTEGMRAGAFQDRLLIGLRAKTPNLSVSTACPNQLWAGIMVIRPRTTSGEPARIHAASIQLALYRRVMGLESKQVQYAPVWFKEQVFMGRMSSLDGHVLEALERLLVAFAADYATAGNPPSPTSRPSF